MFHRFLAKQTPPRLCCPLQVKSLVGRCPQVLGYALKSIDSKINFLMMVRLIVFYILGCALVVGKGCTGGGKGVYS